MEQDLLVPLLSEYDPVDSSEGSLDPLGLYSIADYLANILVPGVRERQDHPRFLTAIAVSSFVCANFDEDVIAKDGVSLPWQVFEWYLVEGLVRTAESSKEIRGLPGRDKVSMALRDGVPLSAKRYLKSPRVFGFHGVYRVLANTLGIEKDGNLEERGYLLVKTWVREQKLKGFIGSDEGLGQEIIKQLYSAVKDGLEKSAIARSGSWGGWNFFKNYLTLLKIGKEEGKLITDALLEPSASFRRQVIQFLISDKGKKAWNNEDERQFHVALKEIADPELKQLIDTILSYEKFSRFIQDAFDECIFLMSKRNSRMSCKELAEIPIIKENYKQMSDIFQKTLDYLHIFNKGILFGQLFSQLADKVDKTTWVQLLFDHHFKVQRNKPPNGKSPWLERFNGDVIINPTYRREEGARNDESYVHYYRTRPLWSFVQDLGLI